MFPIEAAYSVGEAELGDFSRLIDRREDPEITLEQIERKFLADHLRGKGRGRPPEPPGMNAARALAVFTWRVEIDGWPKEAAKADAADVVGVHRATIERLQRRGERALEPLAALLLASWKTDIQRAKAGRMSDAEIAELKARIIPSRKK